MESIGGFSARSFSGFTMADTNCNVGYCYEDWCMAGEYFTSYFLTLFLWISGWHWLSDLEIPSGVGIRCDDLPEVSTSTELGSHLAFIHIDSHWVMLILSMSVFYVLYKPTPNPLCFAFFSYFTTSFPTPFLLYWWSPSRLSGMGYSCIIKRNGY